jgi:alcohol dehydrogenase class IV
MTWNLQKILYRCIHRLLRHVVKRFTIPVPDLISGPGSIEQLPALIKKEGLGNPLLVTDKGITSLGLTDSLLIGLKAAQIQCSVYDAVQPNPAISDIEAGVRAYQDNHCDSIIAFGGGSPMDCAKIIGARISNPKTSVPKMRGFKKFSKPLPPLFAVVTTAGTGSECSQGAMISDPDKHEKFPIASPLVIPSFAVLDTELMVGLPPHITAATGMDALTHAVEAYIGLWKTDFSDRTAEKAVKIIFQDLEAVFRDGSDLGRRHNMAMASHYAGLAFTRAMLGYVHAIAHQLGGIYGVPHGLANAIILPHVLDFSRTDCEDKLARLAIVAGLGNKGETARALSERFIERIREMNRIMDIPLHVAQLQEKDIPEIVRRALKEGNPDSPVPKLMNAAQCKNLVRQLLPTANGGAR